MAITEREQRGLAIAALCKLKKKDGAWTVPSQTGVGRYKVVHDGKEPRCNCPDFETRGEKCKHIFAVEFTIEREVHADGSETLTRSMTVTEKITYSQNWPAYNDAQENEKPRFQLLLNDLCRGLPEPAPKPGRPPHRVRDAVFSMVYKVYTGMSARRAGSDTYQRGVDCTHRGTVSASVFDALTRGSRQKKAGKVGAGFAQLRADIDLAPGPVSHGGTPGRPRVLSSLSSASCSFWSFAKSRVRRRICSASFCSAVRSFVPATSNSSRIASNGSRGISSPSAGEPRGKVGPSTKCKGHAAVPGQMSTRRQAQEAFTQAPLRPRAESVLQRRKLGAR